MGSIRTVGLRGKLADRRKYIPASKLRDHHLLGRSEWRLLVLRRKTTCPTRVTGFTELPCNHHRQSLTPHSLFSITLQGFNPSKMGILTRLFIRISKRTTRHMSTWSRNRDLFEYTSGRFLSVAAMPQHIAENYPLTSPNPDSTSSVDLLSVASNLMLMRL